MKKIIVTILSSFLVASCTNDLEVNHNFSYPQDKKYTEIIKNWGEDLITNANKSIKSDTNELVIEKTPNIDFSFKEYSGKEINSLVYIVTKNIFKDYSEIIIKTFYDDKNGIEIHPSSFIVFENEDQKNILFNKIFSKAKSLPGVFSSEIFLKNAINKYLNDPKFYFDNKKVVLVFAPNILTENGVSYLEFEFDEFKDFLNEDLFPEIKAEREKIRAEKEKYEKLKAEKANGKKFVALTFDDGPSNKTTPQLLDTLKEKNVKATFFVVGKNVAYYPEIVKREFEEGHEIGNHSYNHPQLTNLKDEKVLEEINSTDEEIEKAIGQKTALLRPPYGSHNEKVDNLIGKTIIIWNVDSLDWKHRNVSKNLETIQNQVADGSIILMHDIHQASVDTIPQLIDKLRENGYEFLTVSDLLKLNYEDISKKVCNGEYNCKSY